MSVGFLDSNILVYAFSNDRRSERARLLLNAGGTVGVQCLGEFANVARRKLGMSWSKLHASLDEIQMLSDVVAPVTVELQRSGLALAERYRFGVHDANLIAAALRSLCHIFWSEDLHEGLVVEGRLTIRNPFVDLDS